MALRKILREDDPTLHKKSRPVENFDEKLGVLLDDMAETMYKARGVGLAAPQVGILRQAVVIDIGNGLVELINPEIIEMSGKEEAPEGCLSSPGDYGLVVRPKKVKVKAQDRYGKEVTLVAEDFFARACCHETDHLKGVLFKEIMTRLLDPSELE